MNIGLVQMDGKIPNLALMKIGSFYKSEAHSEVHKVEWWAGPLFHQSYDQVYASKLFQFTHDDLPDYVVKGGTGYNLDPLPEMMDSVDEAGGWFLYPKYLNHLGFASRGCRLKCSFCVVPEKEGKPRKNSRIYDLLTNPKGENRLVLLDDDFLGHPQWEEAWQEILDLKLRVCFSQGLNIRIITEKQCEYLKKTSFWNLNFSKPQVTFAWDRPRDKKSIKNGFNRCIEAGMKPYQMQFFVLIGYDSTPEEDLDRVETLREWGVDPFAMAYDKSDPYQRNFQRWVNRREIFKSCSWKDYKGGKFEKAYQLSPALLLG